MPVGTRKRIDVFPTRVGVDRWPSRAPSRRRGVPHARGGGPRATGGNYVTDLCSPRAWGWTAVRPRVSGRAHVFPTRVGVDRNTVAAVRHRAGVPHARGGGPPAGRACRSGHQCSPRAWGWTAYPRQRRPQRCVFPTRVGVDRVGALGHWMRGRVPHARGGGPSMMHGGCHETQCSPRAWGWTGSELGRRLARVVFPTRVGVDRGRRRLPGMRGRVPHARGGGPNGGQTSNIYTLCSPRAWGWTVFTDDDVLCPDVFPTRVGVDRWTPRATCSTPGVPHARGGGPPSGNPC